MKWPVLPLAKLCQIETGRTPSRALPEYFGGDNVWVTITDLNDTTVSESKEHVTDEAITKTRMQAVPAGTVLLSYKLSLGKLGIAGKDLYTNEAIAALVPRPGIDLIPKYIFYALKTIDYLALCHGAVKGKCLNRASLSRIPVPYPPLSEQMRIVEMLDQADALRKNRAEADAKIEQILPALFYKMFGDPAMNTKGWKIDSLDNGGATVRYGLGQPPQADSKGVPLIRATNISRGHISNKHMLYINPDDVPKNRIAFLSADEVIVVRSGAYTGDVAQITEKWDGAVAGYDLVVSPGTNFIGEYIESYLLSPHIQNNYFGNLKARAGQPHLNAAQVSATPTLRPPKELQIKFAKQIHTIRKVKSDIVRVDEKINSLFNTILYRAFSGDLTAKWREAHMKELLKEMGNQSKLLSKERNV
jgi:type I restriction enzyme S subunit